MYSVVSSGMISVSEEESSMPPEIRQRLEKQFGFLMLKTPCGKFRRVSEYVSDARTKELISQVLPMEAIRNTSLVVGFTAAGALAGAGIGGIIGGPIGIIGGGVVGGMGGAAIGAYFAAEFTEITFKQNYNAWKAELRDRTCIDELKRISKEDPAFEECRDPISFEIYESPMMITRCGHTFEGDEIAKVIALKVLGNPTCPTCRTSFTANDLEPDIVMIAKMKKIYSKMASDVALRGKYSPQVLQAFAAMAKDSERQLENLFTECSAKLLVMHQRQQISFAVYTRKSRELQDKFMKILV